jgi:hypothetical protein
MAHRKFGAVSAVDVLRSASDARRIEGALTQITSSGDAADKLLSLFVGGGEGISAAALQASFGALMDMASAESIAALYELSRVAGGRGHSAHGLDIYGAARRLPIAALLQHCHCCSKEQCEAMEEAGLTSIGDLIRYCTDDADGAAALVVDDTPDSDVEHHVGALALETCGAFGRPALRALVAEARALCAATGALARDTTTAEGLPLPGTDVGEGTGQQPAGIAAGREEEDGPLPGTKSVGC